jgi:hypothetical protein
MKGEKCVKPPNPDRELALQTVQNGALDIGMSRAKVDISLLRGRKAVVLYHGIHEPWTLGGWKYASHD